jgi:hypothetical protein
MAANCSFARVAALERRIPARRRATALFVVPFDRIRGVASGPETQLFRARFADDGAWGVPSFDVSPDGRRFILVLSSDSEFARSISPCCIHFDDELKRRLK